MINRTPYFLDKDTFMASYVIGSHYVDFNFGNVDNCVRKERSSKFLGMEGRAPLKMQSSSGQVIPPTNSKVAHPIHRPQSSSPISFSSKAFLQIFPPNFPSGFSVVSEPIFAAHLFATLSLSEEQLLSQYWALHYKTQEHHKTQTQNI